MSPRTRKLLPWIVTVAIATVAAATIAVIAIGNDADQAEAEASVQVVRENSHRIDVGPADGPVLVEFLDFECEACGAMYPEVEKLREKYNGDFTYIIRYFPIPSHGNSTNAALAVEAAAQQGKLEEMYRMMFETQSQWGESQESRMGLFREYAVALELDMALFDRAIGDPATLERVQFDFEEGQTLGVESTPTFFLDGEKLTLETLTSVDEALTKALTK